MPATAFKNSPNGVVQLGEGSNRKIQRISAFSKGSTMTTLGLTMIDGPNIYISMTPGEWRELMSSVQEINQLLEDGKE